ncbi:hypothetical protein ACFY04_25980 [Streptomyces sp. NPDC001549]|uniref:hypothetical protein n=1 Tax=Streptomyces sp. NPDC001549 TaxID=3364586 RepID=UPI0036BF8B2A
MREEWHDPEQADVIEFFVSTVQEAARRGGLKPCTNCSGLGHIVMVNHVTKEPFKVGCSACNPGG